MTPLFASKESIKEAQNQQDSFNEKKKLAEDFESLRDNAELRALSKVSLKRELTDREYQKMMELRKKIFGEDCR
jgi:hypothetical protein